MLIYDSGLVQPFDNEENAYGLPATKIAEELGSRLVTNIVILGYLIGEDRVWLAARRWNRRFTRPYMNGMSSSI